ncbi:hypothetical protein [Brevibacillus massiliensis]|uniref:hypothetical protein n=1 Tax=Brevibacillus massiliensis TaxID=1118054 RepID=UPI0002F2D608|nr:hypothetical protein [Brevibacillus massiliensis]
MTMLFELEFSEAISDFSGVLDRVQNLIPVAIKPRKQSETHTFLLNDTLVQQLLQGVKFEVKLFREEDGSITLGMDELELYANGETEEKALEELAEDVMIYAQEYMEDPNRYFNAPNHCHHFPYLFKVLMCKNKEEVKQMLLENAVFQKA